MPASTKVVAHSKANSTYLRRLLFRFAQRVREKSWSDFIVIIQVKMYYKGVKFESIPYIYVCTAFAPVSLYTGYMCLCLYPRSCVYVSLRPPGDYLIVRVFRFQ